MGRTALALSAIAQRGIVEVDALGEARADHRGRRAAQRTSAAYPP